MPAATHIKFFEYKPSGKDKKLQKTQTGCHSTFPIHLIRDVNQATIQNRDQHRGSPLNTSHSNASSSSSTSNKSSTKTVNAHNQKSIPPSIQQPPVVQPLVKPQQATKPHSTQPYTPVYQVTKPLSPHACISTTTTVQPTQYYAQTLPSIPHAYLKTVIHPIAAPALTSLPPQPAQHYVVHYHPHQSYLHSRSSNVQNSYPIRISHGISKTHKMTHPVRQIWPSQPLSEKFYDLPQDKARHANLIWGNASSTDLKQTSSPLKATISTQNAVSKEHYINEPPSPPTVEHYSPYPSKISSSEIVYPGSTPTNHLNVGSQTLPSIADLFGTSQSKTFRKAVSISDILH
ncbi:hypothetical protein NAEGRDRAFT_58830 [Naegleria gruberi]|uniref:Uncharacterized protein n=1 Tax=Naegleria gruberi TaxID=5762 RepID=D2VPB2_NAEGR|nr:uncharacterized protein NAEGRDRAFT_58830 [Naegleria gruberi]EFC41402.1 hypothetical protein NAEGRDRAFT_58830 [Naegleria gruberi]|eukprot:XP_002674146.1 hypothetical protein NAEGRDRAFT_58830 [Naegleria gruberi strain NEG-M]